MNSLAAQDGGTRVRTPHVGSGGLAVGAAVATDGQSGQELMERI
jgi:hypothetical protein